ncbi:MAG: hypothetical protein JWP82_2430, partial [Humibacillus sp.]|nr:hypothetical protein [Humibacillus sp.]
MSTNQTPDQTPQQTSVQASDQLPSTGASRRQLLALAAVGGAGLAAVGAAGPA